MNMDLEGFIRRLFIRRLWARAMAEFEIEWPWPMTWIGVIDTAGHVYVNLRLVSPEATMPSDPDYPRAVVHRHRPLLQDR